MIQAAGEAVATLRQDVWVGTGDRRRGLRLGPFHDPRLRLLVAAQSGVSLDEPSLGAFLDQLAESLEVFAVELRRAADPIDADAFDGSCNEQRVLIDWIGSRWASAAPLVLCGIQEGALVTLGAAGHP